MRTALPTLVLVTCSALLAAPSSADEPRDLRPLLERALGELNAPGASGTEG